MLKKPEKSIQFRLAVDGEETLTVERPTDLVLIARVRAAIQAAWYRWQATEFYKRLTSAENVEAVSFDVPVSDHEAFELWRTVGVDETVACVSGYETEGEGLPIADAREALRLDMGYRDSVIRLRTILFMGGEHAPESE